MFSRLINYALSVESRGSTVGKRVQVSGRGDEHFNPIPFHFWKEGRESISGSRNRCSGAGTREARRAWVMGRSADGLEVWQVLPRAVKISLSTFRMRSVLQQCQARNVIESVMITAVKVLGEWW